jgi:NitT/TauT family transport system ATP-binding protein
MSPALMLDKAGGKPADTAVSGAIQLKGLRICFGKGSNAVEALKDFDLDIAAGEFLSVLGPSGCGKSTLVGAIAGFTRVSGGRVTLDGRVVGAPGPDRGVVFQFHTLFPWKTVLDNVAFGLKMRGIGKLARRQQATEILESVGLRDFWNHYPAQLSGGMQQRVSLARVLVNRPRVLLMDEPFSALDSQCRLQMQELLLDLWRAFRMTVLFVTHDVDEALFLSDRVALVSPRPGRVKAIVDVGLERPRGPQTLVSPGFMGLKRRCLELLYVDKGA